MSADATERGCLDEVLSVLGQHHRAFWSIVEVARNTGHPVPTDTRGWSQIVVSLLSGIKGMERKKGADLADGSDVKGANTWEAIDTPRFNGVIKAGTQARHSGRMEYLDKTPFLFFVLWDTDRSRQHRCRIWVVRPPEDVEFRRMCGAWYAARARGEIKSANFQLHPPRGNDTNVFRNSFGNLVYPLWFVAVLRSGRFVSTHYDDDAMTQGSCEVADPFDGLFGG